MNFGKLDVTGRKVSYRIAFESLREVIERLTGAAGTLSGRRRCHLTAFGNAVRCHSE